MEPVPETFNPWLTIWTAPRKTLRGILERCPKRFILWLTIIAGVLAGLYAGMHVWLEKPHLEAYHREGTLFLWILAGVILGLFHLYFGGWLYRLTGFWIGGKGTFTDVKCAIGWSNYPSICVNILGLISLFFIRFPVVYIIILVLHAALLIWAFILFFKLLGEAHQFSSWRAFAAVLIASALITLAILIIALLVPLLKPLF